MGGADFTYLWTAEGWLYVAAVIDLFSRRVVGWSMNNSMTSPTRDRRADHGHLAQRASRMRCCIIRTRVANAPASSSRRLMADHGITCSMSRSGNVWDNAAMESFFSITQNGKDSTQGLPNQRPCKGRSVFDYIERFYNPKRRAFDTGLSQPDGV